MNEVVVSGLAAGASYSLLALALVLVLKATDVPNFAMAAVGLLPTYAAWDLLQHGTPYAVAVPAMVVVAAALGWTIERIVGRRLLGRPHHVTVVITIALWYVLNSIIELIWGSNTQIIKAPYAGSVHLGGAVVSYEQIVVLASVVVVAIALVALFRSTVGLHLRAIAMDDAVPRVLGVSVSRLSALSWSLAAVIASLAVLLHAQTTALSTSSGDDILIGAFVAATLGGFTSVSGAVAGGLILGVAEAEAGSALDPSAEYGVALVLVLGILLLRPSGLFGERGARQV